MIVGNFNVVPFLYPNLNKRKERRSQGYLSRILEKLEMMTLLQLLNSNRKEFTDFSAEYGIFTSQTAMRHKELIKNIENQKY